MDQNQPEAQGLRNKLFPRYDDSTIVFGKNRADGEKAQHVVDAIKESDGRQQCQAPVDKI